MSKRPIFVATHPRACSTAFERVFMTRHDTLKCVHEPFGDAFYFGPERLSTRYEQDEQARVSSGFSASTFKTVFERLEKESLEGKRLFIKDIIHYLLPPSGQPASIAPSLQRTKRGIGTGESIYVNDMTTGSSSTRKARPYPYSTAPEQGNPTVAPIELLAQFHFTFLIRDPHYSIPSYYRCTVPPLDRVTGFYEFDPSEAGYDEVRRAFDYLRKAGLVGPHVATNEVDEDAPNNTTVALDLSDAHAKEVEICVVDADDLLDKPAAMVEAFCKSVGLEYEPGMLSWDTEEDHRMAKEAFQKWNGFHDDAIQSKRLSARSHTMTPTSEAEFDADWRAKYGEEGARIIRETVDRNMPDYMYMKRYAMKV
ncbi:P-loop containing nucleoside triphosphate hydrolase protein [Elaphomyces granulatus]